MYVSELPPHFRRLCVAFFLGVQSSLALSGCLSPGLNQGEQFAAPTIASVSPPFGAVAGGTSITIAGSGFRSGLQVQIGAQPCGGMTLVSETSIRCSTPSGSGSSDVVVLNDDSQSARLAGGFQYRGAPSIGSVSPAAGQMGGGTDVTITGTGFVAGATVGVGGSTCQNVQVLSATQIKCKTGSRSPAGTVDLIVTNVDSQAGTLVSGYTYQVGPHIASVTPVIGTTAGGTLITIAGTDFLAGASVTVGGLACTGVSVTATQIQCTTPAHAAGSVIVKVTNTDAQYWAQDAAFTYLVGPSVGGVSPSSGPLAGGTTLTLSGTNFVNGASATVGGTTCANVAFISSTSLTCESPAKVAGTYSVVVRNPDNQSSNSYSGFSYRAAPTVASISPSGGPLAGGTVVAITGTGFYAGSAVKVGTASCSPVTVSSATSITCTTSSHAAGSVSVTVTNADYQVGSGGTYNYNNGPGVTSISPASGSAAGGNSVTISGSDFVTGATVAIGSCSCTVATLTASSISCAVSCSSAHAPGSVDVTVTNPDTQAATLASSYTFGPEITSISPASGARQTSVTLTGVGFKSGAAISIGGVNCLSTTYGSATSYTCSTPDAGSIGLKSVVITNPDSTSFTMSNSYSYLGKPALWLKADALTAADTSTINSWTDSSGNANHAVQTNGASQPVFRTNIINGLPVVRFDGGDSMAAANSASLQHGGDYSAFGVFYLNSAAGSLLRKSDFGGGGATQYEMTFSSAVNFEAIRSYAGSGAGSAADSNANVGTVSSWLYCSVTQDYDDLANTGVAFHRNGVLSGSPSAVGKTANATATLDIGTSLNGDVAEIMIYKEALSAGDRAFVQGYLSGKYGL